MNLPAHLGVPVVQPEVVPACLDGSGPLGAARLSLLPDVRRFACPKEALSREGGGRVSAVGLRQVTLMRAWEPGAEGAEGERIEFAVALDGNGMPDLQAWLGDPSPWPASRHLPGRPPLHGDVAHDEDGWQLRFYPGAIGDPDLPVHRLCHLGSGLRPGEVLTLRDPNGREAAWRVVGVT